MGGDSYDKQYAELIYKLEQVSVDDNDFKRRLELAEKNPQIQDSILFGPPPIPKVQTSPLIVFHPPVIDNSYNEYEQQIADKICIICKRITNTKWVHIPSCSNNSHIFCESCAERSVTTMGVQYNQRRILCKICGSSQVLYKNGVEEVLCCNNDNNLSQSQISFDNGKCPYHGDLLYYFCIKCSEPLCIKCKNGYHLKHNIETLDTCYYNVKQEITTIENSIKKNLDESAKGIEKLIDIQNKLENDTTNRINDLKNDFNKIRMLLDKKESQLLKQLKDKENVNRKKTEEQIVKETKYIDKCDSSMNNIIKAKSILNTESPLSFVQYINENRDEFKTIIDNEPYRNPFIFSNFTVPKTNTDQVTKSIRNLW